MTTTADSSRHVPIGVIEDYLAQGFEGVLGVTGTPTGRLLINPQHQTLAVQFPGDRACPKRGRA